MRVLDGAAAPPESGVSVDAADTFCFRCQETAEFCKCETSSDEGSITRAHVEPPFVRSVRSVRNPGDSYTSNSDTQGGVRSRKPLTSGSSTSHTSSTLTPEGAETSNSLLTGVRFGDWLSAQTFPPLQFAIPGILPAGFTVLAGPPKAGKSWLLLDWLLAVALGGVALGKIAVGGPRRVLYLALEDSDRRMQERCSYLLGGRSGLTSSFTYCTRVHPDLAVPMILEFLGEYPDTALIAIDTLGRIMPRIAPGEAVYQRDYRVGAKLQELTEKYPKLGVVAAHHTRKSTSADFVDSVSGTQGLSGAADTVIVLSRDRHTSEGVLHVTGRDVEEAEYALVSDRGRWSIEGADLSEATAAAEERKEQGSLGGRSKEIVECVAASPGIRAKELADKFGGSVYSYLGRLVEGGHLCKAERGMYSVPAAKSVS